MKTLLTISTIISIAVVVYIFAGFFNPSLPFAVQPNTGEGMVAALASCVVAMVLTVIVTD